MAKKAFDRIMAGLQDVRDGNYTVVKFGKPKLTDRWKNCPSTHCERRQECASPHECCSAVSKRASNI